MQRARPFVAFLRRSLRANELLFNQTEAQADLQRLISLGNLHNNEASYLSAKLDNLNRTPLETYDRDAEPLVRIPPIVSHRALNGNFSGHCALTFDVSTTGTPENIRVGYCTRDYFKKSSIESLAKWKYNPAIRNGVAVPRANVQTQITYRIQDACGNTLPE